MSEEMTAIEEAADEVVTETVSAPQSLEELKRKMRLTGTVKRTELYGAFIDLGVGTDAILHISQLGGEKVNRVSDVLKTGEEVTVWVDKVDPARNQVTVTMIQPLAVEWSDLQTGQVYTGKVVRLENFGAFVDIGAEKEGLVHVSELSYDYVKHPSEVINVGDEVKVEVLGFSKRKRRINLSIKSLLEKPESAVEEASYSDYAEEEEDFDTEMPTAMEMALRNALGSSSPRRQKKGDKRQSRRDKLRAQQNDILSRTLNS